MLTASLSFLQSHTEHTKSFSEPKAKSPSPWSLSLPLAGARESRELQKWQFNVLGREKSIDNAIKINARGGGRRTTRARRRWIALGPEPPPCSLRWMDLSVGQLSVDAALAQSRHTVLFDTLPLFSTKSRSKAAPQVVQPPHTLNPLSTSTVVIGPHSFTAKVFVAEWAAKKKKPIPPPPPPPPPVPTAPPTPSSAAITPALIMRLNAASAADPVLANLLRKAASGGASNIELGGLARYIEGLRREEELQNPSLPRPLPPPLPVASTSTPPPPPVVPEEPDEPPPPPSIVVQFNESPTQQFSLPSHFIFALLPPDYPLTSPRPPNANSRRQSILLSFFVFPPDRVGAGKGKKKEGEVEPPGTVPVPVDMVIEDCTEAMRDAVWKSSRSSRPKDEQVEAWYKRMVSPFLWSTSGLDVDLTVSPPPPPRFCPASRSLPSLRDPQSSPRSEHHPLPLSSLPPPFLALPAPTSQLLLREGRMAPESAHSPTWAPREVSPTRLRRRKGRHRGARERVSLPLTFHPFLDSGLIFSSAFRCVWEEGSAGSRLAQGHSDGCDTRELEAEEAEE